jgi:hypothetical protein
MKFALVMLVSLAMVSCAKEAETFGAAAKFGAMEGKFVLEETAADGADVTDPTPNLVVNQANGGIAEVFVYLRTPPPEIDPAFRTSREKEVVIESRGGRFVPRAAVVRTDQETRWINSDRAGFLLQVYALANSNPLLNVAGNDQVGGTFKLAKAETIPIEVQADCSHEHRGQSMHLLVVDHPYAAVTDADGRFRIEGLPPGEHFFRVWHQNRGWLEKDWKVTVTAGETTQTGVTKIAGARLSPDRPR